MHHCEYRVTCCSVLQRVIVCDIQTHTHYNALQHTATSLWIPSDIQTGFLFFVSIYHSLYITVYTEWNTGETLFFVSIYQTKSLRGLSPAKYRVTCCSVLQCVVVCDIQTHTHYNALQHTATLLWIPSDTQTRFLFFVSIYHSLYIAHISATRCNTLQHTATRCNTVCTLHVVEDFLFWRLWRIWCITVHTEWHVAVCCSAL